MNKKSAPYILLAATLLLAFSGATWWLWQNQKPVACTADARQCPDGTYVGRVPPKCDFAQCGEESGTVTGRVTVGPICAAEPCDADPVDFSSRQVTLESISGLQISIPLYADGTFYPTKVAPGTYQATLTNCAWLECESELPQTVVVTKDQETQVLIDIDTGIR